jgi:hypothetical protein
LDRESISNGENKIALLFGKIDEDQFALDIYSPLSPLIGVAIAMSVFDTRIGSD